MKEGRESGEKQHKMIRAMKKHRRDRQEGGLKGWTEVQQTDPLGADTGRARVWLGKECVVFSGDPDPMSNSDPPNLSSCILCLM